MALSRALILVVLIASIFSTTMVSAKDFVVGDESGWTTWFDYQSWASNKVFRVGDTLTFKYVAGKDNVVRVNGSDFQSCSIPRTSIVLSSGHDTIVLTTTGRRWYISGVANHCKIGQKLVITVLPQQNSWFPSPSPSPSSVPAPEALPPSDSPWTASVPRRSMLPKKLFNLFHKN
ncbi:blue copper protein 1b-like [Cicer arietinum]|uniref:Mavicyanin-like n=1 Tax=Cicer arietinum TaxID=3827 RepID=A0A1S2XSB6_CICAR|nr:mavicyanin-like [Cicer arietinum]